MRICTLAWRQLSPALRMLEHACACFWVGIPAFAGRPDQQLALRGRQLFPRGQRWCLSCRLRHGGAGDQRKQQEHWPKSGAAKSDHGFIP
jgi:hypothetical protein